MAHDTRYSVITGNDITSEKLLAWIWQHQHLKPGLATTDGERLNVIFPGRRNGLGGPDFRRAIVATPQGELRGDVELHLRSSLWRDHGHQRDPAYNSVVLHVVMWHDSSIPVCLNDGKQVLTVALAPFILKQRQGGKPSVREPCRQSRCIGRLMDTLGEARFMARVNRFQDRFAREDPAHVLYEGIMEALGYSRNQEAFKELAQRLPLRDAEAVVRDGGWEAVYNLLLERGGLMVSPLASHLPCPDVGGKKHAVSAVRTPILCSERLPNGWDASAPLPPLEGIRWQQQGVRPVNQPTRRLLALSHLLERYATAGLLPGLTAAVKEASQDGGQKELESALIVSASNELISTTVAKRQPSLLGRERAGEIAVNILLPFACAYGLESQALGLYRDYAPLAENEITREMSEVLDITNKLVNSACRQQGLIHLFKLFCAERRCGECPLGDGAGL